MGSRDSRDVVIVGAGLAGLACAVELTAAGTSCRIFEASDAVGGRVRTDRVDGFQLDRGFQVLLTAYPEAQSFLDYGRLDLQPFASGAMVRYGGDFHRLADPYRHPLQALGSITAPIGTLGDKLRILKLRSEARSRDPFTGTDTSVQEALERLGFSSAMIDRFFRPFLGGILLDPSLSSSSHLLRFVIRWMAESDVALPARGMGVIAEQLAGRLPAGSLWLGSRVARVEPGNVVLEAADGEPGATVEAEAVVVATEGPEAARLLGEAVADPGSRDVVCLYFAAPEPPLEGPWLVLDGENGADAGPVKNLVALDQVAPGYAPPGRSLVSATVLEDPGLDDDELWAAVERQLDGWFGNQVQGWERLRLYRIPHAQPAQPPGYRARMAFGPRRQPGLYVAGDWLDSASLQGALASGRRAAKAVLAGR